MIVRQMTIVNPALATNHRKRHCTIRFTIETGKPGLLEVLGRDAEKSTRPTWNAIGTVWRDGETIEVFFDTENEHVPLIATQMEAMGCIVDPRLVDETIDETIHYRPDRDGYSPRLTNAETIRRRLEENKAPRRRSLDLGAKAKGDVPKSLARKRFAPLNTKRTGLAIACRNAKTFGPH